MTKGRALKLKLYSAAMKEDMAASKLLMHDEKRNGKADVKAALTKYKEQAAREREQSGKEAIRKLEAMAARIKQNRLDE